MDKLDTSPAKDVAPDPRQPKLLDRLREKVGRFAAYLRKPVTVETVAKLLASFDATDKAGSANV